ncbi:hypothetical protein [Sphingobium sp. WCS2017Hpa-17]|uniref:hypothetical protein n=1 Tax=Sphingobium sp. WCS2017Hpa-17 TaxID=3073638 RepID=UPI0028892F4A|nr:hypothetical protein [Sphingobium sp. WCS2017Hpa-17]
MVPARSPAVHLAKNGLIEGCVLIGVSYQQESLDQILIAPCLDVSLIGFMSGHV